jgi:murein DD-endopeptidase MepM/ murein hydrolase activator NlpD
MPYSHKSDGSQAMPALDPKTFSQFQFAPVLEFPETYDVYDFSAGYDPERVRLSKYGVGKYNEKRPTMYTSAIFQGQVSEPSADAAEGSLPSSFEPRDIHVGIDLAAPAGSRVHAFFDGRIFMTGINSAEGDYGGTLITEHVLAGQKLWALHGHLSHASTKYRGVGELLKKGDVVGWLGEKQENGGWNPHLHFQLTLIEPTVCDLPGVVREKDRAEAICIYPDPRLVLGPLYL